MFKNVGRKIDFIFQVIGYIITIGFFFGIIGGIFVMFEEGSFLSGLLAWFYCIIGYFVLMLSCYITIGFSRIVEYCEAMLQHFDK